jgi:hypothetical protein
VALELSPSPALIGKVRQAYAEAGDMELFGLGARLWEAPSGAHGVTGHFFAPASGAGYTLTLARPDRTDGQFHAPSAFRSSPVWGATLARLAASRVTLTGAQASPKGRLSTSAATRAQVEPWTPHRDAVRGWPCAFDDWALLEAEMQAALTPRLSEPDRIDRVVMLIPRAFGAASFDELTQTLTWPVADAASRWVGLSIGYEGPGRERLETLERLTAAERFWSVLATASEDGGRIALQPYALWGDALRLLDFEPPSKTQRPQAGSLIERLRRRSADRGRTLHPRLQPADPLLDRAWDALVRWAELGRAADFALKSRELGELAAVLGLAGHTAIAPQFARLAASAPADAPAAALRAAYAVANARHAAARLAWMTA